MIYPSVISSFTTPSASDRLNNPSHSALHNSVSSALSQIQAFVGTLSSTAGTLIYDVRAAASDGGGHVQTANKGGTGQTTYTKGDILVAQSTSVLTRVAVGADGFLLQANSSTATGVTWTQNQTNKITTSASTFTLAFASVAGGAYPELSVLSTTIPGSVLGTNNAIRARIFISNLATDAESAAFRFRFYYGSSLFSTVNVASISGQALNTNGSVSGVMDLTLVANAAVNSQMGQVGVTLSQTGRLPIASFVGRSAFTTSVFSVNSNAAQTLGVTVQGNRTATPNDILVVSGHTIEKII